LALASVRAPAASVGCAVIVISLPSSVPSIVRPWTAGRRWRRSRHPSRRSPAFNSERDISTDDSEAEICMIPQSSLTNPRTSAAALDCEGLQCITRVVPAESLSRGSGRATIPSTRVALGMLRTPSPRRPDTVTENRTETAVAMAPRLSRSPAAAGVTEESVSLVLPLALDSSLVELSSLARDPGGAGGLGLTAWRWRSKQGYVSSAATTFLTTGCSDIRSL